MPPNSPDQELGQAKGRGTRASRRKAKQALRASLGLEAEAPPAPRELSLEQKVLDAYYMGLALQEADAAARQGDVPIGAVIVSPEGKLWGRGHNQREARQDPTGHAELEALRAAAAALGHWRVEGTLYVTLEPCSMCAGALVNARVRRVVFGAYDQKAGAVHSLYQLGSDPRLNHRFELHAAVRQDECLERLQSFFRALRAQGQK